MKRRVAIMFVIGAAAAGATLGWMALRPAAVPPPDLADFSRLDQPVADLIRRLHAEVGADPRSRAKWFTLGKAYDINECDELAVACYDRAQALGMSDAELFFHRAFVKWRLGRLDEAVADMQQARTLAPDFSPAHWRLGLLLFEQGRLKEAEAAFRQSITVDRLDSAGWIGLAKVKLQGGENQQAVGVLQEMLSTARTNTGYANLLLGVAYRALGRTEEAEAATLRGQRSEPIWNDTWRIGLLQYSPSRKFRLMQGKQLLADGKIDQAITLLELLLRDWPEEPAVGTNLGMAYGLSGRFDDAARVLQTVLDSNPTYTAAHLNLAAALNSKSGQQGAGVPGAPGDPAAIPGAGGPGALREQAMIHVEKALELNPSLGRAHGLKGELLATMGGTAEAIRSYDQAYKYDPANVDWLFRSAALHFQLEHYEDAARGFELVTKRQAAAADAFFAWGMALQRLGRLAESELAMEQAVKIRPGDSRFESALLEVRNMRATPQSPAPPAPAP